MRPFALIILALACYFPLNAEIQWVQLLFRPGACSKSCEKLVGKRFGQLDYVTDIQVNQTTGSIRLGWKPDTPFSYPMAKRPMQRIGLGLEDILISVHGKIRKKGRFVEIVSEGDNTVFPLISPVTDISQYNQRKNIEARSLDPSIEERLLEAAKNDQMVTIEGLLFQPHRSPPLYLDIQTVNFDKKEEKQ